MLERTPKGPEPKELEVTSERLEWWKKSRIGQKYQFFESRPMPDMARLTNEERSRALDDIAAWEKAAYWDGILAATFTIKGKTFGAGGYRETRARS